MHRLTIERLRPGNGERLRAVRLRALLDAPDAFETTFEESAARPAEHWNEALVRLATFVANSDGGGDVGMVRGAPHDRSPEAGYLVSLWVAPEARGRGIGAALVDAVIDWARGRGFTRLVLDVADGNEPARRLYQRMGFVPNGVLGALPPPRDHVREVQMERIL